MWLNDNDDRDENIFISFQLDMFVVDRGGRPVTQSVGRLCLPAAFCGLLEFSGLQRHHKVEEEKSHQKIYHRSQIFGLSNIYVVFSLK